ncbi:MAG: protein kinase [Bacteroidetes bacterium]|nr:protein kinase [Bacteroidota bacterium]
MPAETWYRQAVVDLGYRIHMQSPEQGMAISRGIGTDTPGKAYIFSKGIWSSFLEYPYSDYPLIDGKDSVLLTIHHLTHHGAYRPVVEIFQHGISREIPFPKIMWDATDYVMMKGLHVFSDGTAWAVGQQGRIVYFNGKVWKETASPLLKPNRSTVFEGDLNDIAMTSKTTGWAVGRNGIILRYENGSWKIIESPTETALQKISMVNDSTGWAVGNSGVILQCRAGKWNTIENEIHEEFFSVYALNDHRAWIVGNNSTLLTWNGKTWQQDNALKIYDDVFNDVSAVKDSAGAIHLWVIGNKGIYTNSQSLDFSFTDITSEASLRRTGKIGFFFERSKTDYPDLFIVNDDGASLLFENNKNNFYTDVTSETELLTAPRNAAATAVGDINNDGAVDILQITDHKNFKLYFGSPFGGLNDGTEYSQLSFSEINPLTPIAAKFIDLDNDGNLDLFLSNYLHPDQLFRNDGTGKFTNISERLNFEKEQNLETYGAVFGDFNNDGLMDIFIPYYVSYKNKFFDLFLNKGNFHFERQTDTSFYSTRDLSPTAALAQDFNNDGLLDIFVHSQKAPPILFLQTADHHFKNVSASVGLSHTNVHPEPINGIVSCADVNNDGWIDIFDGSKLYLNSPQFYFTEVSERVGIQFTGTPTFADIDNDGDMDIYIGSKRESLGQGDRAALFRNNFNQNSFIKVRAVGDISNRMAVGAKILLEDETAAVQSRTIGLGTNQAGAQNLNEVHFGVKKNKQYSVKIIFPNASDDTVAFYNVTAGTILEATESVFLMHYVIVALKSIQRTLLSFHWIFLMILALCAILLSYGWRAAGKLLHTEKITQKVYTQILFAALFLLLFQVIFQRQFFSAFGAAFGSSIVIGAVSLLLAGNRIRKREAQYISHFKILELLGQGGMGKVYKAIDTTSKNIVALKILNQELLKDPENRKRLSAEGHLLSSFHHPNIVRVYEIGESSERGFIAMEFLSGGTLKEKLEQIHPLSFFEILRYITEVCIGLEEVHRNNIVHRDLKTGNVMLAEDGSVRIMDFGLSKSPLVTTMTSLGTVLGTLGYVAPEQVTSTNVDQRTDIFSLGVLMYELLTNQMPFKGENEIALIHSIFNTVPLPPSSLRNDLPKEMDEIVMKCLAKDIEQRFHSVAAVREAIVVLQKNIMNKE